MGNQRIRVDPGEVRRTAQAFVKASQDSDTAVRNVTQAVQSLENQWEGATKGAFYSQYQEWSGNMKKYVELLQGIGNDLNQIAQTFEDADTEIARQLGGS